jgi:hypothetical protein
MKRLIIFVVLLAGCASIEDRILQDIALCETDETISCAAAYDRWDNHQQYLEEKEIEEREEELFWQALRAQCGGLVPTCETFMGKTLRHKCVCMDRRGFEELLDY